MNDDLERNVIGRIDEDKRDSLRKLILGGAFAVPTIASFTMDGFTVNEAHAYTGNQGSYTGNQGGRLGAPLDLVYVPNQGPNGVPIAPELLVLDANGSSGYSDYYLPVTTTTVDNLIGVIYQLTLPGDSQHFSDNSVSAFISNQTFFLSNQNAGNLTALLPHGIGGSAAAGTKSGTYYAPNQPSFPPVGTVLTGNQGNLIPLVSNQRFFVGNQGVPLPVFHDPSLPGNGLFLFGSAP